MESTTLSLEGLERGLRGLYRAAGCEPGRPDFKDRSVSGKRTTAFRYRRPMRPILRTLRKLTGRV